MKKVLSKKNFRNFLKRCNKKKYNSIKTNEQIKYSLKDLITSIQDSIKENNIEIKGLIKTILPLRSWSKKTKFK
jgi:hypothetical protein